MSPKNKKKFEAFQKEWNKAQSDPLPNFSQYSADQLIEQIMDHEKESRANC